MEALQLLRKLHSVLKLPESTLEVATSHACIGSSLGALGRHKEALDEQCAALAIRLDVLGERHPDVATSRDNIGSSLGALGRHEEALDCLLYTSPSPRD